MFGDGNLAKHSKYELLKPLKKLLDTSGYQSDKTEVTLLAVGADFLTVIHETEFERHSKIRDSLKRVRNFIIGQSKVKRIDIVCHWLKGSLRMQRAIEKPVERMNLNLDSPVPSEIKKFWTSSINKETPAAILLHYRSKRCTERYCTKWLHSR